MRILIAEDDLTSRVMLVSVLKKHGHEAVPTVNGEEAWEAMQKSDAPRLAILDWMMPVLSGVEVVRRIRADTAIPQPYLIMLTTKGEKSDLITGLEAGANDYLVKPFHPAELKARVTTGIRLVELQDQMAEKIKELSQALDDIKTLQGFLPICMHCKKIRNDKGYWEQVEGYVSRHSKAVFSHGVCPECMQQYYPEP